MKRTIAIFTCALLLTSCANIKMMERTELTVEEGAKEECRYIDEPGSILKKKVCNNKATWAAIAERDKDNAEVFKNALNDRNAGQQNQNGF